MLVVLCLLFFPLEFTAFLSKKESRFRIYSFELKFNKKKEPKKNKPPKKADETKPPDKQKPSGVAGAMTYISAIYRTSPQIKRTLCIKRLSVRARIGLSDAAATGLAVGFGYAEIYKLIALLACIFTMEQPEVTLTPDFDHEVFDWELNGIIKTRLAHIIFTGLTFYFNLQKVKKEQKDPKEK